MKFMNNFEFWNLSFEIWILKFAFGVLMFLALPGHAQDQEPATFWRRIKEKGLFERLWEMLRLYENEENSTIQALAIVGRYHGQYWYVHAGKENAEGWENRRVYLGAEARLFRQLLLHGQIAISEDFSPFYDGLYQAFVKWSPSESFSLSAGRVDFLFTGLERSTSSNRIVTFERGLLVNQVMPGEVLAAMLETKRGNFSYRLGVLSGSIEQEFTNFAGGVGAVAGVNHDLPLFYEAGSLHLDYLFNDGDPANNALAPYDHIISLWHQGQKGPVGLGVDLTWGHGLNARPQVFGVTLLPSYKIAQKLLHEKDFLLAVLRYQYSASKGNNGLQLQNRYEQEIISGQFGDHYHACYAGINYDTFGDRLKFMTGVEYAVMHEAAHDGGNFEGWTYFVGTRVFF